MAKINDNIFCSGGKHGYFYILSVNPIQLIQKFILSNETLYEVEFIHNSNDGFIFTSCNKKIIQYKIIENEDNNFIRLEKFDEIESGVYNSAIITNGNGKIFYEQKLEDSFDKTNLFLTEYKS